jgi:hypothetical protein
VAALPDLTAEPLRSASSTTSQSLTLAQLPQTYTPAISGSLDVQRDLQPDR